MIVLFDFATRAPCVTLIIPRLGINTQHRDMLDATWAACDVLLRYGYVEQASRLMEPFQQAQRVAA